MDSREQSVPTASPVVLSPARQRIDLLVSRVLRVGVLVAALIGGTGLILLFVRGPQPGEPHTLDDLLSLQPGSLATSPSAIVKGLLAGQPESIMRLGLLVLILTPTLRVALTVVLFLMERDWFLLIAASVVLAILLLGLFGLVGG